MTPGEPECAGLYLRSTAASVTFPDSADGVPGQAQGHASWVSLRRAREILRLMLLPSQVETAMRAVDAMAVTGEPPTWAAAAAKWPRHLRHVLATTARVDRDAFVALLVLMRHSARKELVAGLKADFTAALALPGDVSVTGGAFGPRQLSRAQFAGAAAGVLPGLLTRQQLDGLYDQGVTLARAAAASAARDGSSSARRASRADEDDDEDDDGRHPLGNRAQAAESAEAVAGWGSGTWVAAMVALAQHLLPATE
jgi:hypothetical protein